MEKFEEYRKNLAEEIKETPKEERKAKLDLEKSNPEYDKAKELHQAKKDVYKLTHTETLKNPKDPDEITDWIKTELEDYAERNADALFGFVLEDVFEEITKYLAQRLRINSKELENLKVTEYWSHTTPDKYEGEGTTEGTFSLMGRVIFTYSSLGDGYSFSIDEWHEDSLRESVADLLKRLNESI